MEARAGRVLLVGGEIGGARPYRSRLLAAGYGAMVVAADDDLRRAVDALAPDVVVAPLAVAAGGPNPVLGAGRDVPVIVVTEPDASAQARVAARRAGAAYILSRPVDADELVACVDTLVGDRPGGNVEQLGDLTIDHDGHTAWRGAQQLGLTPTEYRLLVAFAGQYGCVLSKPQLLDLVWGFEAYDVNVVEVHVSALRRKLEQHRPRLIHTVRGIGYVMRAQAIEPGTGRGIDLAATLGGIDGLRRFAAALRSSARHDPLLARHFENVGATHADNVATWLAAVFGPSLPASYRDDHVAMLNRHVALAIGEAERRWFVELVRRCLDLAGLPADADAREAILSYIEWESRLVAEVSHHWTRVDVDEAPEWHWPSID